MGVEEFSRFTNAMNNASLLAQRDLAGFWESLDKSDPAAVRDALLAYVPALVQKYGDVAALAAAEYYEAERMAAGGSEAFRAELAEAVPAEQVEAAVRYACGHLFRG